MKQTQSWQKVMSEWIHSHFKHVMIFTPITFVNYIALHSKRKLFISKQVQKLVCPVIFREFRWIVLYQNYNSKETWVYQSHLELLFCPLSLIIQEQ